VRRVEQSSFFCLRAVCEFVPILLTVGARQDLGAGWWGIEVVKHALLVAFDSPKKASDVIVGGFFGSRAALRMRFYAGQNSLSLQGMLIIACTLAASASRANGLVSMSMPGSRKSLLTVAFSA
jgi:hypothetical protein